MASNEGFPGVHNQAGHSNFSMQPPVLYPRRLRTTLPSNQGLLKAFAALCGFVVMVTYLETSRMLIPSKVVSKRDLHSLTSGFTKDISATEFSHDRWPAELIPHPQRPKAIVVGFSHCGAPALVSALSSHPNIVVNMKDLNYFTGDHSLKWYLSRMPPSFDQQTTIDLCLTCIANKTALNKIKSFNETVRIILVVCDPISRLLTNHTEFLHQVNGSHEETLTPDDHTFKIDLDSLKSKIFLPSETKETVNIQLLSEIGDYFRYTIDLFQVFSRHQVYIVEKDRFFKNFASELSHLFKFLKVPAYTNLHGVSYERINAAVCYNFTHRGRTCIETSPVNLTNLFQSKHISLLHTLKQFYRPFNKRLFLYLEDQYHWL